MKGFLHRLAAGAVQPQVRLHPLMEPMFAPRVQDGQLEMPLRLEVSERVGISHPMVAPSTGDVVRDADAGRRESAVHEPITPMDAASGFEPLVQGKSVAASEEHVSVVASAVSQTPASVARGEGKSAEGGDSRLAAEHLPLIIERLMQGPGAAQPSDAGTAQTGRTGRGAVPAPVPERVAQVTPDEIQIHIGRIEVIATPPPAPRVAPAPARKSMSLDEYLNRRDGRVG